MKTTAAVLRKLQDYYDSLPDRPSIKEVARETHMPVATTARYLNGTTQSGDIERVRALCLALDRHDLLEELPNGAPAINSFQEAWALIVEIKKESRESNLEELDRVRKLHEDSEKRLLAELERTTTAKNTTIEILNRRIERLEKDKENQALINVELNTEMKIVRDAKRKRDAALIMALIIIIVLLVFIVAYLIKFDVPNPSYGLFS